MVYFTTWNKERIGGGLRVKKYLFFFIPLFLIFSLVITVDARVYNFENLPLSAESYWNGSDGSGGFTINDAFFSNNYYTDWGSWEGFSYSNLTDTVIRGYEAQCNAITGQGVDGSANYAVGYDGGAWAVRNTAVTFSSVQSVIGAYFTNSNYTYYSMKEGDSFAKKFEEGDWFKLTVTGRDINDDVTEAIEVYLAQGVDIVNTWIWVDLNGLGMVKSLEFTLSSSDTGDWGMNTPAYFCMDNLTAIPPEDTTCNNSNNAFDMYTLLFGYWGMSPTYPTENYSGIFGNLYYQQSLSGYSNIYSFFKPYSLYDYAKLNPASKYYRYWPFNNYLHMFNLFYDNHLPGRYFNIYSQWTP